MTTYQHVDSYAKSSSSRSIGPQEKRTASPIWDLSVSTSSAYPHCPFSCGIASHAESSRVKGSVCRGGAPAGERPVQLLLALSVYRSHRRRVDVIHVLTDEFCKLSRKCFPDSPTQLFCRSSLLVAAHFLETGHFFRSDDTTQNLQDPLKDISQYLQDSEGGARPGLHR